MKEHSGRVTEARFFVSLVVILIGVGLMYFNIQAYSISAEDYTSIGYGLFTTGVFAYIILANQRWNPLVEANQTIKLVQSLTGFAGLLWWLALEQIIHLDVLMGTTITMFVIGISLAVLADAGDVDKKEIKEVYYGIK